VVVFTSETDYGQTIEEFGQEEGMEQLELVFQLYKEEEKKKELGKKLQLLKKDLKRADVKDISNKLKALKIVVREHKNRIKEFKSKIKESYNLFEIKRNVEKNGQYLKNLAKEYKKGELESNTYETTRIDYSQKIEKDLRNLKRLQLLARSLFRDLKSEAFTLEKERVDLRSEWLRKNLTKISYNKKKELIEKNKNLLRKKLIFLNSEIIDY
jgi:hypothetical protein